MLKEDPQTESKGEFMKKDIYQVILAIDGKVFDSQDFISEKAAKRWAESFTNHQHYHVSIYRNSEDDPMAQYIVTNREGLQLE